MFFGLRNTSAVYLEENFQQLSSRVANAVYFSELNASVFNAGLVGNRQLVKVLSVEGKPAAIEVHQACQPLLAVQNFIHLRIWPVNEDKSTQLTALHQGIEVLLLVEVAPGVTPLVIGAAIDAPGHLVDKRR